MKRAKRRHRGPPAARVRLSIKRFWVQAECEGLMLQSRFGKRRDEDEPPPGARFADKVSARKKARQERALDEMVANSERLGLYDAPPWSRR